jgi:hypothetical protein
MLDSPCWGSRSGLSPPISTSCPAHPLRPTASATPLRREGSSGEKPWPPVGRRRGRQWGGWMAAAGEKPMAIDTGAARLAAPRDRVALSPPPGAAPVVPPLSRHEHQVQRSGRPRDGCLLSRSSFASSQVERRRLTGPPCGSRPARGLLFRALRRSPSGPQAGSLVHVPMDAASKATEWTLSRQT